MDFAVNTDKILMIKFTTVVTRVRWLTASIDR